jgi:hypothetical protein
MERRSGPCVFHRPSGTREKHGGAVPPPCFRCRPRSCIRRARRRDHGAPEFPGPCRPSPGNAARALPRGFGSRTGAASPRPRRERRCRPGRRVWRDRGARPRCRHQSRRTVCDPDMGEALAWLGTPCRISCAPIHLLPCDRAFRKLISSQSSASPPARMAHRAVS